MNWETLIAIIGAVGGVTGISELIKFWVNRNAAKRTTEAEAATHEAEANDKWFAMYEHQLERMNQQIEFKDRRIEDLNAENAEKEKRYIEQTKRLRESQDREYESQAEIRRLSEQVTSLTKEVGDLKLFIEEHQCRKLPCPFRQPQNRHTRKAIAELGVEIEIEELPAEDPEKEQKDGQV